MLINGSQDEIALGVLTQEITEIFLSRPNCLSQLDWEGLSLKFAIDLLSLRKGFIPK